MSSILIRRANMVSGGNSPRLPAGYTELAYLESSGTQYISIGVSLSCSTDDCEVSFYIANTDNNRIFGARSYTTSRVYALEVINGNWRLGWGNASTELAAATAGTHVAYIDHDGGVLKIDGATVGSVGNASTTTNYNALLWAVRAGSNYYYGSLRISEFKTWRSGSLRKHLIPAMRDSDSVVGMYDLVSNTFLTNAGSGTFSYGTL